MLGGVCGGLAEYSGLDPLLWRVGFVALALAGPGLPVYLLLWLLMPGEPGAPGAPAPRRASAGRAPAGPRSPVPGVTMAGLLIVVGVLVLLTRFTGWNPGPRAFLGAALLVVGAGLVVSAFVPGRRSRGGLISLGIVLSIALTVASIAPWNFRGGIGDHVFRPLNAASVHSDYDAGVGNTTLDLTRVDLASAQTPIRTDIDGGVGNLHVLVPHSADVRITVDSGLGNVSIFGNGSTDGYYAGSGPESWTDDGNPEFVITIDAGVGNVEVDRA
jgi:phage shock protein PspC (stress-responsive transcriptional regulator)